MNILLIDRDAQFAQRVRDLASVAGLGLCVERYDPMLSGAPGPEFPLRDFDMVLIDHHHGSHDGLECLRQLKARTDCPAAVILAGQGNEALAVRAMKLGAHDYLPKQLVTKEWLECVVRQARIPSSPDSTVRLEAAELPRLEGYRAIREVGAGAASRVYLVVAQAGGAPVIAKVLRPNLSRDPRFHERFLREFAIIARIRSHHVGQVLSQGYSDGVPYLVMEYLSGGDLRTYFTGTHVEQGTVLRIFRQVLMGLADIHAAGIIHRDLKPHNVMFRADRSVALVDFGIARCLGDPGLTAEGSVLGTPLYMSPEVASGRAADARSDLYSAGILLYQMLAGRAPFTGKTADDIIDQQLNAVPPPLPRAQDEFQPLVDALLEKDPERRPASAADALRLIEQIFYGVQ